MSPVWVLLTSHHLYMKSKKNMSSTQDHDQELSDISAVAGATSIPSIPKIAEENTPEWQKWIDSLEHILEVALKDQAGPERAPYIMDILIKRLREAGVPLPAPVSTPYLNTIDPAHEPEYPGDREIERRIKSLIRWNAMAMVVKANEVHPGLGGHISTFASSATLYEVGFNHFFHGGDKPGRLGDFIYFQGHASPGNYARAYLERRLNKDHLHNFRQELAKEGGLSSYPHPYLMPDFWQFPTVSMGLGPIMSIYQARFLHYLKARGIIQAELPKVWCYVGDGEAGEPESFGNLNIAGRDKLDNLIWVINCNLQRLDGPVHGNGKIIQEFESVFRGAGWNVIKVIWGSEWDELMKKDTKGLLLKRMSECCDGDYQKYSVEPGSYTRKHFFGKYPELLAMVNHLSDVQITKLLRGGHDPKKVYAAYKAATEHKGEPTVILAKTIKGYGLGEAGEGRNITHQQKKLNEKELREFRARFDIPISDEEIAETPFYRPPVDSPEMKYLFERRKSLGGFLPERKVKAELLQTPDAAYYEEFLKGSGEAEVSTTMAFVRILTKLLRNNEIGKNIVPIIPDEARTFGMDALFRQVGIYAPKGQLYEPVDIESLLYFKEAKDGQILEEGINEAGSMASFIAAGTSHATVGTHMIPFYIYYSMFGFQRVGDLMWLCGDIKAKGFLLGGTSGRTTLNGEGLQHQDGHSQLMASTIPSLVAYDPAFAYELAVIIEDGINRMYQKGEDLFYYLSVYNENHTMPAMPEGCRDGILKGLYKFKASDKKLKLRAQLLGSGPIIQSALKAQKMLEKYGVAADVWSVTSYNQLRREALEVQRLNRLNPTQSPKKSYVEKCFDKEDGVFVAVSDNMKIVSEQIAPWVPGKFTVLGTDGFGRSDTREKLRRFFEIDAESVVIATLYALHEKGELDAKVVKQAMDDFSYHADKKYPQFSV